ncbi:MAG TPA: OB-fold nucleic acid binding domain-containing protein, partial [Gammaproteobacteria bacterium]|nr:OB-fold nucleic acid binding domain-containing protein [Gammaproteobacteria bacterium]
ITYRTRSAVRDLGKALGLDALEVERLARAFQWWDGGTLDAERIREAGLDPASPVLARLAALLRQLIGFPRHLSQHVGGFVISRGPLAELVPVENAAMPQRTVIQWDKDDLDALGLLKVDVLALGMLSALRRALELRNRLRGGALTLAAIPAEDPAVYAMLRQADTVGVFQVESRAQMAMLPRLKPATFYDLVIQVAIVRPGPIQGEMVHPYLARRAGTEAVSWPSAEIKEVLGRTLGVPIFQEQVMRLAVVAAGFTPGEADQLRRAMGAWRRTGSLGPFEDKLLHGLRERGYPEDFARRLYQQIRGFGEYGFPESHAASFALLAYASAWLKHHEPAAFVCALLNSQPMGFYAPAQLVADARRHGVEVRPVVITASGWDCSLEVRKAQTQPALRLGLCLVRRLSQEGAKRVVAARAERAFDSVADLARRARLDRRDLDALGNADALKPLAGHRYRSAWKTQGIAPDMALGATSFAEAEPLLAAPGEGENLVADYASIGLTLGRHPLALLRERLDREGIATAAALLGARNGGRTRTVGIVTHRQRPGTGQIVFVTLEDESGTINVIVRPAVAERDRRVLLDARLLGAAGVIQREAGVLHVIARRLFDYTHLLGTLAARSRDFR